MMAMKVLTYLIYVNAKDGISVSLSELMRTNGSDYEVVALRDHGFIPILLPRMEGFASLPPLIIS